MWCTRNWNKETITNKGISSLVVTFNLIYDKCKKKNTNFLSSLIGWYRRPLAPCGIWQKKTDSESFIFVTTLLLLRAGNKNNTNNNNNKRCDFNYFKTCMSKPFVWHYKGISHRIKAIKETKHAIKSTLIFTSSP